MKYKLYLWLVYFLSLNISLFAQEHQYAVYFKFNQSNIPDSSLIYISKYIHANNIDRVLIEGHCDSVGSKIYNYKLSIQRANEVKRLLTDNGINEKSIKTCIGYGKDKPASSNETYHDRQLNRRAILTFYSYEKEDTIIKNVHTELIVDKDEFQIKDLEIGQSFVLKDLYFFGGRHIIKPSSIPELNKLLRLLKRYPTLKIQIQGHVCCTTIEADGYDWDTDSDDLSSNRARAIMSYLIQQGISVKRLSAKGFGGTQKINQDESTEELRAVNRRVEIHVIEK